MTTSAAMTAASSERVAQSKVASRIGWVLSGLMIAFMLFDSLGKIALEHHVIAATTQIGYPLSVIQPLGIIALVCTILYAIPRTSVLGAILLTGYLGGAIASNGSHCRSAFQLRTVWCLLRRPHLGWALPAECAPA